MIPTQIAMFLALPIGFSENRALLNVALWLGEMPEIRPRLLVLR